MRNGDKLPYWPAMMLRKTAAAYLDMSEAAFEREVSSGTLPMPVILGNKPHWHRDQIDTMLADLSGAGDWRATSKLYSETKPDWRAESWIYNDDIPPPVFGRRGRKRGE